MSKLKKIDDMLDGEDFYNLMQAYRMANVDNQEDVTVRFEAVKEWARQNYNTEKCICKTPMLQSETKQCGKCKMYIDRVRHILFTNMDIQI